MGQVLPLFLDRFATPIGEMLIIVDGSGNLRAIDWVEHESRTRSFLQLHYGENGFSLKSEGNPSGFSKAIRAYFAGELHAIDSLPVQTAGTPFQQEVWQALRQIPCGTTISYAQLAEQIGRPKAVRAVGLANGCNPIPIVVPCHRVIGSDGSLTGYGGGMERKRWLLEHEKCAGLVSQKKLF
jgi:methylated-DNA-[protein]-cysteine S-methyltransferase